MSISSGPVVIAGAAHLKDNRERDPANGQEPLQLLVQAARRAAVDAGSVELTSQLDGISVVHQLSWNYDDLAELLARELGCSPAFAAVGPVGGQSPVALLDAASGRISSGESNLELVCAAESLSSLRESAIAQLQPDWTRQPGGPFVVPDEWKATPRMWGLDLEGPVRVYPLFENALRARLGQSFSEAQAWSGEIYARFSAVAAKTDAAWNQDVLDAADIVAVTEGNRMVCWPYPMRLNSLMAVDQAAAVLLVSEQFASTLGVPERSRVHVASAANAVDSTDVLERPDYSKSFGLERVLAASLEAAERGVTDIDAIDLYSCFPVVPKLASLALGWPHDEPLTTTGGMNSFGGAGNGYALHAVVTAAKRLREQPGSALVYANGEYLTKHAALVLTSQARIPVSVDASASPPGPDYVDDPGDQPGVVETFTVEFGRDGLPQRGWVIARLGSGARSAGRVSDGVTLTQLVETSTEPIGRSGRFQRQLEGPPTFQLQ